MLPMRRSLLSSVASRRFRPTTLRSPQSFRSYHGALAAPRGDAVPMAPACRARVHHPNTQHHVNATNSTQTRLLSTPPKPPASTKKSAATVETLSPEAEVAQLKSEISQLSYLMKQMTNQLAETQDLSRRAEARAYIIEEKLMDIQKHVVKIPALETLAQSLRTYMTKVSPQWVSGASFVTSKYTAWGLFVVVILFWQYRRIMYQRTSEEVANVAAMTLQQENLRTQIQETLTTVANSPETLASLNALFQKLITDERTEQHLINLIVRALNSEGVRDAAIHLLDFSFQNEDLQGRAGEFLKVAANATVLDDGVQKSAGVGIQQALKNAVVPWWVKSMGHNGNARGDEGETDSNKEPEHGESSGNAVMHQ